MKKKHFTEKSTLTQALNIDFSVSSEYLSFFFRKRPLPHLDNHSCECTLSDSIQAQNRMSILDYNVVSILLESSIIKKILW